MRRRETHPKSGRPTLLCVADNPYIFDSSLAPLVDQLAPTFEIWIVAVDFHMPESLPDRLSKWAEQGTISGFEILPFFVPNSGDRISPWRSHRACAASVRRLPLARCDVVIAHQTSQPWSPYVLRNLDKRCVRVEAISSICHFLADPSVVQAFRQGLPARQALALEFPNQPRGSVLSRLQQQQEASGLLRSTLRAAHSRTRAAYVSRADEWAGACANRPPARHTLEARAAGFGPADLDVIMTQQLEVVPFLAALFPEQEVRAVTSPLVDVRAKQHKVVRDAVLVLLPYVTESDVGVVLPGLVRDLTSVRRATGLMRFDLRPHPRSPAGTTLAVRDELAQRGLGVGVDTRDKPVWERVGDYAGVVGAASSALLEAAYAIPDGFAVGLVDASLTYTSDPRLLVGESQSERWLTWMEADGSFDPGIFARRLFPNEAPAMRDVICSLMGIEV